MTREEWAKMSLAEKSAYRPKTEEEMIEKLRYATDDLDATISRACREHDTASDERKGEIERWLLNLYDKMLSIQQELDSRGVPQADPEHQGD